MNKGKITIKQNQVLDFIAGYQAKYNTRPTNLEIASYMGVTVGAIHSKINSLIRRKMIVLDNLYIIEN
jgi:predicted transcriptional regulator